MVNKMNVHFSSVTDHYSTPKDLFDSLNQEFHFDFDPCPLHCWDKDGLIKDWGNRTFCNPPYSEIKNWIKKAWEESQKGKLVVLLIPSRTDTKWWHEYIMQGEIRFLRGRLKFGDAKNSAPFPSAVVIFRGEAQ